MDSNYALVKSETPGLDSLSSWLASQLSPHTKRAYAADIRQFLAFVGTDHLAAVRREDLHDYRAWLVQQYMPATVNRKLSAIRQLLIEAVRHGLIASSPAEGIKGHKSEGNYSSAIAPSLEQVKLLLESLEGDSLPDVRDQAMIYLMATLGLRREEVADLNVSSLVTDGEYTCLEIKGKGSKRRREVIPGSAVRVVRRWIEVANLTGEQPLFSHLIRNEGWHMAGRLSGNGIWHIVKRRMHAVGIAGCSPHSLRRFIITYLLERGMELWRVQRLAGHSSPVTTQRYNLSVEDSANSAAKYVDF